jgi:hypothetical protein
MPREERSKPLQNARHGVVRMARFHASICPVLAVLADGQYHAGLLKFFE